MRLLVIGALEGHMATAIMMATKNGAKVRQVGDVESALSCLRAGQGADLIMIDVKYPISQLIQSLIAEHFHIPVVGCGVEQNTQEAVAAIRAGAKEYIPLPPDEAFIAAILQAITVDEKQMIFQSPSMEKILTLIKQIAPSDVNILITGESGTGKEVVSHRIHQESKRKDQPFICVNCAAIPDNLLESELFGHEKGAFTGAVARRIGKFEEANNGTILLDEISEMDIRLQAKLLRVLQEREVDRVGGTKPVKINIRVLATSNRDLRKEVAEGRFREDLFFRLNTIQLQLPPLRDRASDIALLARYFVGKYSKANGLLEKPISDEALKTLLTYSWPGNVRELENSLHRAVLLSLGSEIEVDALMLPNNQDNSGESGGVHGVEHGGLVGHTVESVERELILQTMEHCLGNSVQASNLLGISIRTLRNKLESYRHQGADIGQDNQTRSDDVSASKRDAV
jgi:two-component system response regulator FlrC